MTASGKLARTTIKISPLSTLGWCKLRRTNDVGFDIAFGDNDDGQHGGALRIGHHLDAMVVGTNKIVILVQRR